MGEQSRKCQMATFEISLIRGIHAELINANTAIFAALAAVLLGCMLQDCLYTPRALTIRAHKEPLYSSSTLSQASQYKWYSAGSNMNSCTPDSG